MDISCCHTTNTQDSHLHLTPLSVSTSLAPVPAKHCDRRRAGALRCGRRTRGVVMVPPWLLKYNIYVIFETTECTEYFAFILYHCLKHFQSISFRLWTNIWKVSCSSRKPSSKPLMRTPVHEDILMRLRFKSHLNG